MPIFRQGGTTTSLFGGSLSTYKYCVSFRVLHPDMKSFQITDGLRHKPTSWRDAGTKRVGINGMKLGGVYKNTLWSLDLCDGDKIDADRLAEHEQS